MKRAFAYLAGLATIGFTAAYAASPDFAGNVADCCDFVAACCKAIASCC